MVKLSSALALGLSLLFATAARAEPFRLSVAGENVVATGATAKGRVVFFGVTREVAPDDVVESKSGPVRHQSQSGCGERH